MAITLATLCRLLQEQRPWTEAFQESVAQIAAQLLKPDRVEKKKKDPLPLPENLQGPDFAAAWERWIKHRQEIHKPITPTAMASQLAKLSSWGKARALAAIDHSVASGWQGIFEEKTNGHANGKPAVSHRQVPDAAQTKAIIRPRHEQMAPLKFDPAVAEALKRKAAGL